MPAVFHCAAGKDRTGLLAALLLGSLGVSHDDIVADYTLTVEGMARFRVWAAREWPEWAERMASMPPAFTAALPEAMRHILDELCAEHGSIRNYVRSIGVSDDDARTRWNPSCSPEQAYARRDERHPRIARRRPVRRQRRSRSSAADRCRRDPSRHAADGRCLRAPRAARRRGDDTGASGSTSRSRR